MLLFFYPELLLLLFAMVSSRKQLDMAKASGKEYISHGSEVLGHISEHFNNPDISDVTLIVGQQEFAAHRFVLATQSKVFHSMLLGDNWKESLEKKITLEESTHGEAAFADFLKFFYSGKLLLTTENVCGIHTLADKYDVPCLKVDCVAFMKDVLTGVHGDALKSAFKWMQYIEMYVPDLLVVCFSAIRTNFMGITHEFVEELEGTLTNNHVINILNIPDIADDIVVDSERRVYAACTRLSGVVPAYNMKVATPLIRFYNMDTDVLKIFEKHPICGRFCSEAYKVHAERANIFTKACKKRRMSDGSYELRCPCNPGSTCPHINPRFYFASPWGKYHRPPPPRLQIEPIDLSDVEAYTRKVMGSEERKFEKEWSVTRRADYSGDAICERYTVTPSALHCGRRFSIAIVVSGAAEKKNPVHKYTIKHTGAVNISGVDLCSPLRSKDSWKIDDSYACGISILLHK